MLRVELRDWEGSQVYAHYGRFQLDSERLLYRWVSRVELSPGTAVPDPPGWLAPLPPSGAAGLP